MSIIDGYEYDALREVFLAAMDVVAAETPLGHSRESLAAIASGQERDGLLTPAKARLILAIMDMKNYAGY